MNVSEKEIEGHNDLQQEEAAIMNTQQVCWLKIDTLHVFDNF